MQLPRADVLRVWGAPLSQQEAGALVARGVAIAYADVLLSLPRHMHVLVRAP
jgi:hypothetical protein